MKILAAAALALALSFSATQAMPLGPVIPAVDQGTSSAEIIQVAQGCGPGGHRGPWGHCRPLYNCPPGWHTGPYGKHCMRNW